MAGERKDTKTFATLAEDLRKIRKRKPSPKQIEELNSILEKPTEKSGDAKKKKSARPPETGV